MLVSRRNEEAPALDASSIAVDVRSARMRIGAYRTRNVTTDYGLVARASPFLDHAEHSGRTSLTLMLDGQGRCDERGRRGWLGAGELVLSDVSRRATEAYGGAGITDWIVVEWHSDLARTAFRGPFRIERLSSRDLRRVRVLAEMLRREARLAHAIAILDVLRSAGAPIERVSALDFANDARPNIDDAQRVGDVVYRSLSQLERFPDALDLARELGVTVRTLHRRVERFASSYGLPWLHWRAALKHTRMVQALRWLSADGATTERVARLTGFRSAIALCHAFAAAGLPSPGALARAARHGALVEWAPATCPELSIDQSHRTANVGA